MTALAVPTLVVAGLFDPSVSVLPLTQQAMVPCPSVLRASLGYGIHDGSLCDCGGAGRVPFEGPRPIHIAHQCPECDGHGWLFAEPLQHQRRWRGCLTCGGTETPITSGSGWVYRSAQAEQVPLKYRVDLEWRLRLSGVSSETSPYLGDVTPGWKS